MKKLKIALFSLFGSIFFINPLFCSDTPLQLFCSDTPLDTPLQLCRFRCGAVSVSKPGKKFPFRYQHHCTLKDSTRFKCSRSETTIIVQQAGNSYVCPFDPNCKPIRSIEWIARHHRKYHRHKPLTLEELTLDEKEALEGLTAIANQIIPENPE